MLAGTYRPWGVSSQQSGPVEERFLAIAIACIQVDESYVLVNEHNCDVFPFRKFVERRLNC